MTEISRIMAEYEIPEDVMQKVIELYNGDAKAAARTIESIIEIAKMLKKGAE